MEKISPHRLPSEFQLKEILETPIGLVYFYGNIVVFEANEGVTLSYKSGFSILLKGLTIVGTKPVAYISNRIHSYSIKPIDYKYLNKVPTLKCVGIVTYTDLGHSNAQLESKFCKKPFGIFGDLSEAVLWGKGYL
ncbi:hypothetical protein F3C99_03495 [Vitellibacter sp. q18]|jgi:hypothetical protein|nr:hypothetical protein [Aequorivita lutea]